MSYGGAIRLLPDRTEAEQFSTLVHELAQGMLHKSNRRTLITKTVRATEAEAIAFVVCQSIGLETGSASSDYIQLYHGNFKLLQESLEIVQRTAAVILGAVAPEPVQAEKAEAETEAAAASLEVAAVPPAALSGGEAVHAADADIPFQPTFQNSKRRNENVEGHYPKQPRLPQPSHRTVAGITHQPAQAFQRGDAERACGQLQNTRHLAAAGSA